MYDIFWQMKNLGLDHRRRLWGARARAPPIIEKRPCIYHFLPPSALTKYFGLSTQYFWQVYASGLHDKEPWSWRLKPSLVMMLEYLLGLHSTTLLYSRLYCVVALNSELLQIAGITQGSALGPGATHGHQLPEEARHASDVLEAETFDLKLDKSNILMLGPTGSGTSHSHGHRLCSASSVKVLYKWSECDHSGAVIMNQI